MPAKKDRCVKEVKKSGKSTDAAYAICTAALDKKKSNNRKKK